MERHITAPPPDSLAAEIKKREPFDCPAQEVYLNLMRTHSVLLGPMERLFKDHGVSAAKYNILRILRGGNSTGECSEHGLPSLEIADRLITRVPDITRLVDGLEEDGLVVRTRCNRDRRVVYVGITAKGMELLGKLDKPVIDMHQDKLEHLTSEELTELNRLLLKARHPHEEAKSTAPIAKQNGKHS
jgi:DNA-binding MarR family transcriptional regulator